MPEPAPAIAVPIHGAWRQGGTAFFKEELKRPCACSGTSTMRVFVCLALVALLLCQGEAEDAGDEIGLQSCTSQLQNAKAELDALQDELDDLKLASNDAATLKQQLATARRESGNCQRSLKTMEADSAAAEGATKEAAALKKQLLDANQALAELQGQLKLSVGTAEVGAWPVGPASADQASHAPPTVSPAQLDCKAPRVRRLPVCWSSWTRRWASCTRTRSACGPARRRSRS
jgi:hypothetical protein